MRRCRLLYTASLHALIALYLLSSADSIANPNKLVASGVHGWMPHSCLAQSTDVAWKVGSLHICGRRSLKIQGSSYCIYSSFWITYVRTNNNHIKTYCDKSIMNSFRSTSFCLLVSMAIAISAHPNPELQALRLHTVEEIEPEVLGLQGRDFNYTVPTLPSFCFTGGDCVDCFGAGYQLCPDSGIDCYKPGDSQHGLDTCPSQGSGSTGSTSTTTSVSPAPTVDSGSSATSTNSDSSTSSSSNITTTDFCDNGGFDCKRCFGSTFIPCPESSLYASDSYCYDPNNATSVCPDGTSPAGSSESSESDSVTESVSASYTASTPSVIVHTGSPAETASITGTSGAGTSSAGTNSIASTPAPGTTNSRPSSATGSAHTLTTSGDSNGNPISATTNGQPVGKGISRILAVLASCFAASVGFVI